MIFFVTDFLRSVLGMKMPLAFENISTRMMLAAITSLLISILFGARFIKRLYELKIGQSIRTADCPLLNGAMLHEKKKDTPTMGGALILFSMIVSMLLWMNLRHVFTLILFITTLVLGWLGARDDYLKLKYKNAKGLSPFKKILVQIVLGGVIALYLLYPPVSESLQIGDWFIPPVIKEQVHIKVHLDPNLTAKSDQTVTSHVPITMQDYASRLYIPFFKGHVITIFSLLAGVFIICVMTGTSNAVNLTDGLDGLAAGCLMMVASCLALIAFISNNLDLAGYLNILYIEGSGEIAIYLSAFIGACIGFLWYNGYPAQVFMGDTGSLALGGIIGVSAVLLKKELLLVIIGGVFVAEALSVILQVTSYRLRNKQRIFLCAPLHHHFEYKGWPESKVVLRFWIVGLLLAIIGMTSLKFQ